MFPWSSSRKLGPELGDALRDAVRFMRDFATLGEAEAPPRLEPSNAPTVIHPHRRTLDRPVRAGRPGTVRPRPQPCRTPLATRPTRVVAPARKKTSEHH